MNPPPVCTDVVETPLSERAAADAVAHPRAGAVVTFVGAVRDHDGGRGVDRLGYSAHPGAADALARIAAGVAAREGVVGVWAQHRIGELGIGDAALVVAVSAEHRRQAFTAAADLVDEIKTGVPIWKHQVFADGSDEWVGLP